MRSLRSKFGPLEVAEVAKVQARKKCFNILSGCTFLNDLGRKNVYEITEIFALLSLFVVYKNCRLGKPVLQIGGH